MSDLISRQAAIDALEKVAELFPWRVPGNRDSYDRYNEAWNDAIGRAEIEIEELPSAHPDITDEQAIVHLQASGWIQSHDKQMYEMGLKERLADDSDSYDALLPAAQQEQHWIPCSERLPQPNEEAADGFIKAYLVQDGRWMDVARWNGDCWIAWGYGTALINVTAWMPLPEPYKGGQE